MSGGMGLDEFLKDGKRGGGGDWLKGWKDEGSIVVWLHTRAQIFKRFGHQFHHVEAVEDKETRKIRRMVRFMRFGCWEGREVWATRRDKNTRLLETPPSLCPMCRLKEAIIRVPEKKLAGDAVVFRMRGVDKDDEEVTTKYVKGFLTGEFERTKTSWKQTLDLGLKYLFTVVLNDKPEAGAKITEEAMALGDAVRRCIADQIDGKGDEDGNPFAKPYAIKWTYDEAASPRDKYKALAFPKAPLTDEIRTQIADVDPPDLAQFVKRGDAALLRSYAEAAITPEAKAVLDLDDIFGPAEKVEAEEGGGEDAEPRRAPPRETPSDNAPAAGRRKKKAAEPEPEMGDPCDDCGAAMRKGQSKCGKCGAEYEVDDDPSPPAKPAVKTEPKSAKNAEPSDADDDPFSADIPFMWLVPLLFASLASGVAFSVLKDIIS